ncbi:hypothetical protein CHS0354_031501 [Potamilus streckersoni]|uniref:Inositol polyphosphate 1-phosphatase n=1 Tax=Potamilus streckersoni TaxID=2493646 RepID=A0AAE0SH97_9BIVA|nr:hypothetical protein CHS0354_031501 [Potamilus streckersoni]
MKINELLNALLNVSEKGANIARIIRSESSLLDLLVQEKKGDQKNERFLQDFKTLADVLVQELVRYDLVEQFPGLRGSIHGEESNKFTNTLGESVSVSIKLTREETSSLLTTVLNDDKTAADLLSAVVHSPVHISQHLNSNILDLTLAVEDIGVWIDPIDSTAQYIQGQVGKMNLDGLVIEGLQCVCVLIGAYNKKTGLPVLGVINQPFYEYRVMDDRWTGHITWGVHLNDVNVTSFSQEYHKTDKKKPILLMSSSESSEMKDIFIQDFDVQFVTGAGYKLLCVSQGLADAYVLTKNSIFKWDCCGPHAVLQASDGGIVKYDGILECLKQTGSLTEIKTVETFHKTSQIKYYEPDCPNLSGAQKWCNDGGIIAYRSIEVLHKIALALEK